MGVQKYSAPIQVLFPNNGRCPLISLHNCLLAHGSLVRYDDSASIPAIFASVLPVARATILSTHVGSGCCCACCCEFRVLLFGSCNNPHREFQKVLLTDRYTGSC